MKPLDPEKLAQLTERAHRLGKLKEHESWAELRGLFEERRARHYERLQKQLLAGGEIDQRYIDRLAGFFKGAQWVLDNPEMAEKSLDSAIRKAELLQTITEEVNQ